MKKFLITLVILGAAFIAALEVFAASSPPTRIVTGPAQTNTLLVSGIPCKVYEVDAFNSGTTNGYLFIFEQTNYPPTNNEPSRMGPYTLATNSATTISFHFYGADMDRCIVAASSTSNTFTATGTNFTLQAIVGQQDQ